MSRNSAEIQNPSLHLGHCRSAVITVGWIGKEALHSAGQTTRELIYNYKVIGASSNIRVD